MQRTVIIHADDVGMCVGANRAFLELSQHGLVSCGSLMAPCPAFEALVVAARGNQSLDLGVHLTLTSEWQTYRWRPLSTTDPASGLLDEEGYFWRRPHQLRQHMRVAAVETELRAQIEQVLAAGIDVTHLDTHMGAALLPELIELYLDLGLEYRLPVLLPHDIASYAGLLGLPYEQTQIERLTQRLAASGMPLVDQFRMTPAEEPDEQFYQHMLATLPAGLSFLALHPNAPGDIEEIAPHRAAARLLEYRLLQDPTLFAFVAEQGITTIGYRQLRDQWRSTKF